jgi:hypothetical protein
MRNGQLTKKVVSLNNLNSFIMNQDNDIGSL